MCLTYIFQLYSTDEELCHCIVSSFLAPNLASRFACQTCQNAFGKPFIAMNTLAHLDFSVRFGLRYFQQTLSP